MKFFDMMYYFLATFYKKFSKKRSVWELQSIFVITITQFMLLLDLWMYTGVNILNIRGRVNVYEKVVFLVLVSIILFLNIKRYEKKYLHYNEIWGVYEGVKKKIRIFITFFTVVFAWCFIFIVAYISDRY